METVINGIIEIMAAIGDAVVFLLPTSPFSGIENMFPSEMLGYINYYVPVREMVDIGAAWVLAVGLWYLYGIILRWVKAIQ